MLYEIGYHKLSDQQHWESIQKSNCFHPSVPAERHWLGEGVYFFLNPNGLKWAIKWPHNGVRQNSTEGIIIADIDTSFSLDFRDSASMSQVRNLVNTIRTAVIKRFKQYSDGAALKMRKFLVALT